MCVPLLVVYIVPYFSSRWRPSVEALITFVTPLVVLMRCFKYSSNGRVYASVRL